MAHFDEKAGVVVCATPWGSWHQTIDEVVVVVAVPPGTTTKQIKVNTHTHTHTHTHTILQSGHSYLSIVGMRQRGVQVKIGPKSLSVHVTDGASGCTTTVLDGALHAAVKLDDSTWTLEDRKEVCACA